MIDKLLKREVPAGFEKLEDDLHEGTEALPNPFQTRGSIKKGCDVLVI